jgi:hypothetical protein
MWRLLVCRARELIFGKSSPRRIELQGLATSSAVTLTPF